MDIELTLSVDDDDMVDSSDPTGLTNVAYEALVDLLSGAGYGIVDGPNKIEGS